MLEDCMCLLSNRAALLGNDTSAHDALLLEHNNEQSCFCQVRCTHEPIVTAANDDCICSRHELDSLRVRRGLAG